MRATGTRRALLRARRRRGDAARLIDRYGYEPEDEHGRHLLALKTRPAPITIEPGGQIELSGEQCETIHCAHQGILAACRSS